MICSLPRSYKTHVIIFDLARKHDISITESQDPFVNFVSYVNLLLHDRDYFFPIVVITEDLVAVQFSAVLPAMQNLMYHPDDSNLLV
jgi:hypothetical protein